MERDQLIEQAVQALARSMEETRHGGPHQPDRYRIAAKAVVAAVEPLIRGAITTRIQDLPRTGYVDHRGRVEFVEVAAVLACVRGDAHPPPKQAEVD